MANLFKITLLQAIFSSPLHSFQISSQINAISKTRRYHRFNNPKQPSLVECQQKKYVQEQLIADGTHRMSRSSLFASPFEVSFFISFEVDRSITVPLVTFVALVLGLLSQLLINSMLKGDRGLRSYLSDGSGFNNSGFVSRNRGNSTPGDSNRPLGGPDPLPWLKLPDLDFVEVAGNEKSEDVVVNRLERLADEMRLELKSGNVEKATSLRNELEGLMKEYGYQFEGETDQ